MSALAIIVLVVVVATVALALFVFVPRARERGRAKRRDRELRQRRDRVISQQREEAAQRSRRAEEAEQRARIAEQEANRERAEAQLRQERAALHDRGMADHELVVDHERERFAGTSAVGADAARAEHDGDPGAQPRTSAFEEGRQSVHDPARAEEFQRAHEGAGDDGGLLGRFRRRRRSREPVGRT
jgi:hypothetical protein